MEEQLKPEAVASASMQAELRALRGNELRATLLTVWQAESQEPSKSPRCQLIPVPQVPLTPLSSGAEIEAGGDSGGNGGGGEGTGGGGDGVGGVAGALHIRMVGPVVRFWFASCLGVVGVSFLRLFGVRFCGRGPILAAGDRLRDKKKVLYWPGPWLSRSISTPEGAQLRENICACAVRGCAK